MVTVLCVAMALVQQPTDFAAYGREALTSLKRDFTLPNSALLGEDRTPSEPPKQVAFNWGVGVMLSALNAAARVDKSYEPWLREYTDAVQVYWNDLGPVPGYDVLPTPKPVDRYYDDNAWMVMSLVEAYEQLKDPKYLDRAEASLKYVLSGYDDVLGGGIYWRESDKASKNTCSNAPSAAAILAVYEHRKDPARLKLAQDIYAWTKRNLQDPEDKLMWDNISKDGKEIGKAKFTYNTGLMIRTAKHLYKITGDKSYLKDAQEMEDASVRHWLPEPSKGVRCDGKFAHLMFDAWVMEPARPEILKARDEALAYVYQEIRDKDGRYGNRWDRPAKGSWDRFSLIDQASAARAYFKAAKP